MRGITIGNKSFVFVKTTQSSIFHGRWRLKDQYYKAFFDVANILRWVFGLPRDIFSLGLSLSLYASEMANYVIIKTMIVFMLLFSIIDHNFGPIVARNIIFGVKDVGGNSAPKRAATTNHNCWSNQKTMSLLTKYYYICINRLGSRLWWWQRQQAATVGRLIRPKNDETWISVKRESKNWHCWHSSQTKNEGLAVTEGLSSNPDKKKYCIKDLSLIIILSSHERSAISRQSGSRSSLSSCEKLKTTKRVWPKLQYKSLMIWPTDGVLPN